MAEQPHLLHTVDARAAHFHAQLPAGPCNYKDHNISDAAHECRCRRFWLNEAVSSPGKSEIDARNTHNTAPQAWCFCGHHACFHDSDVQALALARGSSHLGDSFRMYGGSLMPPGVRHYAHDAPKTDNRPASSWSRPDTRDGFKTPSRQPERHQIGTSVALTSGLNLSKTAYKEVGQDSYNAAGLGLSLQAARQNPAWPAFFDLPPTQIQMNAASEKGSAGDHGLPLEPTSGLLPWFKADEHGDSATEVATPSIHGTPALKEFEEPFRVNDPGRQTTSPYSAKTNQPLVRQDERPSTRTNLQPSDPIAPLSLANQNNIEQFMAEIASLREVLASTPNLGMSLESMSKRIEFLETASFSHLPEQEVQDKFDYLDTRIIEVSNRVDDLENWREHFSDDNANERGRRTRKSLPRQLDSQDDTRLFSGSSAHAFEEMDQRLERLESLAPPSLSKPWSVEVIYLPWGQDLKGIWFPAEELTNSQYASQGDRTRSLSRLSGGSTGTTSGVVNHGNHSTQVPLTQEWGGDSEERLVPKALGATQGIGGRVFERLKSRGFVRTIAVTRRDASEIHENIVAEFAELLDMQDNSKLDVRQLPLGLQSALVPLRKIHRSSRLRFLNAAELTTPSLWTAEFLDASVFMKAAQGQRRLFVTSPMAYIQSSETSSQVTWQRIRELPRFQELTEPTVRHSATRDSESSFVGEADAREDCWVWDSRIDKPISVHSSFASSSKNDNLHGSSFGSHRPLSPKATQENASQSSEDEDDEEDSGSEMDVSSSSQISQGLLSTNALRQPITPISEFPSEQGHRQPYRRTVSLPLTTAPEPDLVFSKRNAASFEQFSATARTHRQLLKRRRLSRTSDEAVTGAWSNLTPRLSREPPSPCSSHAVHENNVHVTVGAAAMKRGTTPSAYATPFSNNTGLDWPSGFAEGDTDIDVDIYDREDEDEDEEDDDESDVNYSKNKTSAAATSRSISISPRGNQFSILAKLDDDPWEGVDDDVDVGDDGKKTRKANADNENENENDDDDDDENEEDIYEDDGYDNDEVGDDDSYMDDAD